MRVLQSGTAAVALCLPIAITALAFEKAQADRGMGNPFFAFQDGLNGVSLEEQAKLLERLGYDGIEFEGPPQQVAEMLRYLDAHRLKMFCMYTPVYLTPEKGKPAYAPGLKTAIEQLKGRDTVLWIPVIGGKPSATDLDDRAVALLGEIADMADKSGLRIALYPHYGCYVEKVGDALRPARKLGRKNVGATFNLCHFLKVEDEKDVEKRLEEAMPHLFLVSINGADSGCAGEPSWNRLIQTLDRGNFDVGRVLKKLRQLNYAGPIGLQCFAIPGDPRENLERSIKAWRRLSDEK